jgi:hypothetical protein
MTPEGESAGNVWTAMLTSITLRPGLLSLVTIRMSLPAYFI